MGANLVPRPFEGEGEEGLGTRLDGSMFLEVFLQHFLHRSYNDF
jgi:hypothetical protein